jgi:hypothetical protein
VIPADERLAPRCVGTIPLERPAVNIMNMRRPIQADRNRDVASLETIQPLIVDQQAVGGHRDGYFTACANGYGFAGLGDAVKILNSPQERLAAMQDDGKINQGILGDMLLDALQQLVQHLGAHELGLVVNGRVTEPVTIGAVNVASRRNLHQQLRDRLVGEDIGIYAVSRHADTTRT